MPKIDLKIRMLTSGELFQATFENEPDAQAWLAQRPRYYEVLTVMTPGLSREQYWVLRAHMRPLDAEEKALKQRWNEKVDAEEKKKQAVQQQALEEETRAWYESARNADPNRPMAIEWTYDRGFRIADPTDKREIPEAVRRAVILWVRERDEWVKPRNMFVGQAMLYAWPAAIPPQYGNERILPGGQFIPLSL